ncbi:hypothetical protein PYCC9005_003792 [Savitreella phatthalungensis]
MTDRGAVKAVHKLIQQQLHEGRVERRAAVEASAKSGKPAGPVTFTFELDSIFNHADSVHPIDIQTDLFCRELELYAGALVGPVVLVDRRERGAERVTVGRFRGTMSEMSWWQVDPPTHDLWRPTPESPRRCARSSDMPLRYVFTANGVRHPFRLPRQLRPPVLYERYLPSCGETFSLRVVEVDRDLGTFHEWHNSERVNAFWGEQGTIDHHRTYLENALADAHLLPVIGEFDGVAVCYFELYYVGEDHLGPHLPASHAGTRDYDRGWHALVGNSASRYRGPDRVGYWITAVTHFLFLDDVRTQNVYLEPRVDNAKFKGYLSQYGYNNLGEFDFPHKRASLMHISRQRFFQDVTPKT